MLWLIDAPWSRRTVLQECIVVGQAHGRRPRRLFRLNQAGDIGKEWDPENMQICTKGLQI